MPDGATPPSEFRIWKWGENKTQRGSVVLDKDSAAAVIDSFNSHGIDLAIDYEHQTFSSQDNGKEAPAAGWFKPEVREDGLWAASVQWTEKAAAHLKSREYRYYSPVALLDAKTRKPVRLMPMALTNWPATRDIQPLVARADDEPSNQENKMKTVLVALGLKADADETEAFAAVNGLRDFARAAFALTGKDSPSDALGVLTALKMKAESADSLAAELTKLKVDHVAAEKTALIDAAIKGGVAPAKRAELETLELSALKVCLSMLPKAPPPAVPPVDGGASAAASGAASGLTADQLKILKLTGMTPEKYAEHKAVMAQLINPIEEN